MRIARHGFFLSITCAAVACSLYGTEETKDDPATPPSSSDGGGGFEAAITTDTATPTIDSGVPSEAGLACHGEFGPPIMVGGLRSNESEYSARLTPDERTVYITRPELTGVGLSQTWVATRATTSDPFTGITKMGELGSSSESIAFATLPSDQLTIVFQVRAQADASANLFQATRTQVSVPFSPRKQLALSPVGELAAPYVTPSGDALWFSVNQPTVRKIVRVSLKPDAAETIREHGELGTDIGNPVVTPNELEIFFYRPSGVHHATRTSKDDAFDTPALVRAGVVGLPSWISPDGCRLYVCIDVATDTKSDVYVLNRAP